MPMALRIISKTSSDTRKIRLWKRAKVCVNRDLQSGGRWEQISKPCILCEGLANAMHVIPTTFLVRASCFRKSFQIVLEAPVFCNALHVPSFRVTIFETKFMPHSDHNPTFKWHALCIIYSEDCSTCVHIFYRNMIFVKIYNSYCNAFSLFILKYRPVNMTDAA